MIMAYLLILLYKLISNKNEVTMMAITREELHHIIDQIPENRLPSIEDLLSRIYEEEQEELSASEAAEIDKAKKRIVNGEYATFDEVFGDLEV
jgi:hypothetical protein